MVLHICLRLRTAEFIPVLFTFFRHVHVPSGQPKTVLVPPQRVSDVPCLLLILKTLIAFQKMFPQNCKKVKSTNKEHHNHDQSQNCDSILPNQSIVSKGGLHIDK